MMLRALLVVFLAPAVLAVRQEEKPAAMQSVVVNEVGEISTHETVKTEEVDFQASEVEINSNSGGCTTLHQPGSATATSSHQIAWQAHMGDYEDKHFRGKIGKATYRFEKREGLPCTFELQCSDDWITVRTGIIHDDGKGGCWCRTNGQAFASICTSWYLRKKERLAALEKDRAKYASDAKGRVMNEGDLVLGHYDLKADGTMDTHLNPTVGKILSIGPLKELSSDASIKIGAKVQLMNYRTDANDKIQYDRYDTKSLLLMTDQKDKDCFNHAKFSVHSTRTADCKCEQSGGNSGTGMEAWTSYLMRRTAKEGTCGTEDADKRKFKKAKADQGKCECVIPEPK